MRKNFTSSELGINAYAATSNFSAAAELVFTWTTSEDSGVPVIVNHTQEPSDSATHRSCTYQKAVFSSIERQWPALVSVVAAVILSFLGLCCCFWCTRRLASRGRQVDDALPESSAAHLVFVVR